MPLALITIGIVLMVSAVRGTTSDLFALLKGDFTGQGNFLLWVVLLAAIGVAGNVKTIRPIANTFLILLLIVFLVGRKGVDGKDFFSSFLSQVMAQPITLGARGATEKDGFFESFTDSSKNTQKTLTTIAKLFGL